MSALVALTLAQLVVYEQPFELPGTEASTGWSYTLASSSPRLRVSRAPDAGYLSDAGLRFEVSDAGGNLGSHIYEYGFTAAGRVYLRGWARVATLDAPFFSPFVLQATGIGTIGELVFVVDAGAPALQLRSSGPAGVGLYGTVHRAWPADRWLQLEVLMENVGAPDASVTGALDGVIFDAIRTDWSGVQARRVRVGFPSGLTTAGGVIDLDEVLVATAPTASRLVATARDAGGGCVQVLVGAEATFDGGFLPAALPVALTIDGARGVATECAPANTVTLTALEAPLIAGTWAVSGEVGFLFSAAGLRGAELRVGTAAVLDAGQPDAGPGDAGVDAGAADAGLPDAGLSDGGANDAGLAVDAGGVAPPRSLSVGCGCASTADLVLLTSLAWVLCPSRRRRARGCR